MDKLQCLTSGLAEFVSSLTFEDLPAAVIEKCKLCMFHSLACSFASRHFPWSQTAIDYLRDLNIDGNATLFVEGLKAPSPDIAFVNAVMAHGNLHEDTDMGSGSHTGAMVIPAALAVGEETNCTGKDLFTAIVLGYELTGRVGASVVSIEFAKTFRPTSFFGAYGVCASAAKLLGLDHDQTVNALGMAGSLSTGLNQWAMDGTDDVFFHAGFTASDGIKAAMLGKRGINAAKRVLEGRAGLWAAYGEQEAARNILEGFGDPYAIMRVYFKPIPADACTASPNKLALRMAENNTINPEEIRNIEVEVFQLAKDYPGIDYPGPFTSMTRAKMSAQYGVAAVLVHRRLDQSIYDEFKNPLVERLSANTKIEADEAFSKNFPRQGCRINITMQDGTVISDQQDDVLQFTDDEVVDNFKHEAGRMFGDKQAEALADSIRNLESVRQVRELSRLYVKKS
ncbi:MAG: MmgE/PrpD family protein [Proteobacteria bacterium]|nr:MmgE/PrpD family protein [Pseudomonadota bacterium]